MSKKIKLKIVTQHKIIFENEVESLYVTAQDGRFGILPDHIPAILVLGIGVTKAMVEQEPVYIATMGGVLQFKDNEAVILTDVAELGDDIDETRARHALEQAQARIAAHSDQVEILRAQFALAKAIARINACKKNV